MFQRSVGGARERKAVNAKRGATCAASQSIEPGEDLTISAQIDAPPPAMFCKGADDRQVPQSCEACVSAFRWVLACNTAPNWAQMNASDSS